MYRQRHFSSDAVTEHRQLAQIAALSRCQNFALKACKVNKVGPNHFLKFDGYRSRLEDESSDTKHESIQNNLAVCNVIWSSPPSTIPSCIVSKSTYIRYLNSVYGDDRLFWGIVRKQTNKQKQKQTKKNIKKQNKTKKHTQNKTKTKTKRKTKQKTKNKTKQKQKKQKEKQKKQNKTKQKQTKDKKQKTKKQNKRKQNKTKMLFALWSHQRHSNNI